MSEGGSNRANPRTRGNGDGSIYRRGDKWEASITVWGPDGKRHRRKRLARTKTEAKELLKTLQREAAAGLMGSGRTSVAAFLDDWYKNILPSRNVTFATRENYHSAIENYLKPALGRIRLDKLTADHVDAMLRDMISQGKARATARLARTVLSMALTHAERREMVVRNAARLSVLPEGPKSDRRSLTSDEASLVLDAAKGTRLEAAWCLQLQLGLRPGEVRGLAWNDIDLDQKRLCIRCAQRREGGKLIARDRTKTPRSVRSLDLPRGVVAVLKSHKARQAEERLQNADLWQDLDLVICTGTGTPIDPSNYRREFRKVVETAGLDHLVPHELRHSAASLLMDAGKSAEDVAYMLGHSSPRMLHEVYRHKLASSNTAHVAVMESLFGTGAAS